MPSNWLIPLLLFTSLPCLAQLEDCPDLPQEGEGYYPAFAPPFNVDTTNGGWSTQPPRFQELELDGTRLCGSLFRYQDESGTLRHDEDWFELFALGMPYAQLALWTEGDWPVHYELLDHRGALQSCGTLPAGAVGEREARRRVAHRPALCGRAGRRLL